MPEWRIDYFELKSLEKLQKQDDLSDCPLTPYKQEINLHDKCPPCSLGLTDKLITTVIKSRVKKACMNKSCNTFTNLLPLPKLCLVSSRANTRTCLDCLLMSTNFLCPVRFSQIYCFPKMYKKGPSLITPLSLVL